VIWWPLRFGARAKWRAASGRGAAPVHDAEFDGGARHAINDAGFLVCARVTAPTVLRDFIPCAPSQPMPVSNTASALDPAQMAELNRTSTAAHVMEHGTLFEGDTITMPFHFRSCENLRGRPGQAGVQFVAGHGFANFKGATFVEPVGKVFEKTGGCAGRCRCQANHPASA